ncbi:hypothetical protein [Amycolatopsis sp. NBC_01480]|uniref:hypothetical protein n=1 Tax=Amycolatopsis sp. NBC_01480 TaxID=2903562 RepID=UPI002E2E13D9|nr:hypothetical protein [Amycolatopsis sp. NBC_01480]
MTAAELGRTASELAEVDEDAELLAGARDPWQGCGPHWTGYRLDTGRRTVARPADGRARRTAAGVPDPGRRAADEPEMDLRVRLLFMDRLHESIPGSGSASPAAASPDLDQEPGF